MRILGCMALSLVDDIVRPVVPIVFIRAHKVAGDRDELDLIDLHIHHHSGMDTGAIILEEDAETIAHLAKALNIPLCSTMHRILKK